MVVNIVTDADSTSGNSMIGVVNGEERNVDRISEWNGVMQRWLPSIRYPIFVFIVNAAVNLYFSFSFFERFKLRVGQQNIFISFTYIKG